jgi:hypothetical protein
MNEQLAVTFDSDELFTEINIISVKALPTAIAVTIIAAR